MGCADPGVRIPRIDGPLVLELRYPLDGTIIAQDSTAIWGSTGSGRASLDVNGRRIRVEPNGAFADFVPLPAGGTAMLRFRAHVGSDTVTRAIRIPRHAGAAGTAVAAEPRVRDWTYRVRLRRLPSDTVDSATQARPIFTRWLPDGSVAFGIPQGMRLFADARTDDHLRLRIAPGLRVWVPAADAEVIGPGQPRNHPLHDLRVSADSAEAVVSFALEEPVFSQAELGGGHLVWTVYGVDADAAAPAAGPESGIIRSLASLPSGAGTVRLDIALADEPLGWKTEWQEGRLRLRIRTLPRFRDGLRGLVVGLDAGHPPEGSTGAAGLREDSMTLAVARAAADRLRALGARPVLIRENEAPVSLDERIARAERMGVHVFISIHGNSPGPGRPPRAVLGTAVYWFWQNAYPLARALHLEVARALGQRPLALVREDLAVLRPTWYPAILVEGTAMVVPEREAFLRTQRGIDAYADGIVAGLRDWLSARDGGPQ